MARKHNVEEVLRTLKQKNDVRVNEQLQEVLILSDKVRLKNGDLVINPKKKFDLGNGSLGKISFLVNYKGYRVFNVSEF